MKPRRPALRWHGGKWLLAPWIISHFPPHRCYTEAFGGAGSVLMRKPRSYSEVYNDLDTCVVTLFRVLQNPDHAQRLINLLRLTPYSRDEFDLAYDNTDDAIECSRRLIIRSYMGFGSDGHNRKWKTGFRAHSRRLGTTPAHDWANYPDALRQIVDRLVGVVIENRDALELIDQQDSEDTLHYVDPPYVHSTRQKRRAENGASYAHEMTDANHSELAQVLHECDGAVVLSGYPSELYSDLYGDWEFIEREAMADGGRARTEVLWFNPRAAASRMPLFGTHNKRPLVGHDEKPNEKAPTE